jgi:hypothetical protein
LSTPSRIRRLLSPLLDSHSDLVFAGDRLFLRPVRNALRFIYIQEFPKFGTFDAYWSVQLLCCPADLYELGGVVWMGALFPDPEGRTTFFELPEDEQSAVLCRKIEEDALRKLGWFGNAKQAALHFIETEGPNTHNPQYRFWFELVLGRFDSARAIQAEHRAEWLREAAAPWYEDKEWNERLETVCRLFEHGQEGQIAPLLHEWEAITAKNFGIEHIWEPTPFPFEAA